MSDRMIPVGDRLLLIRVKPPDEARGLAIPEEAQERPQQAHIVAVGDGCGKTPDAIARALPKWEVGDRILIGRHAGTDVTLNWMAGEHCFVVIRESEIMCRLVTE